MDIGLQTVIVDGIAHQIGFRGFHEPMELYRSEGETLVFLPWTYGDHKQALSLCLSINPDGIEMSAIDFSQQVLNRCCLGNENKTELYGLALWWASGGINNMSGETNRGSWTDLGPTRVQLREWTNAERVNTIYNNLLENEKGESFDVVEYVNRMVHTSVESLDPKMELDELDPRSFSVLLESVLNLNVPENKLADIPNDSSSDAVRNQAETTLKICSILGWTPSQVWSTSAVEIDRILALIDTMEKPSAKTAKPAGKLAQHPDAVVIQFEDD